jgi:outer membrane protein OmpA-like peptidoglycan-associated protein
MKYTLLFINFCLLFLFGTPDCKAQSDFTLGHKTFSPHGLRVNPAAMPTVDLFIGLPIISNSSASFGNNSFTYRDFVKQKVNSDSIYFDFDGLISNMNARPSINLMAQTDLLSFGWLEGRYYLSANITEKFALRSRFRKELFELGVYGNGPTIGETTNLGDLRLNMIHYREYAVGVSRGFGCKLNVGISAKLLYGMENIDIDRSDISFKTDDVTFDLTGSSDILINTSGLDGFTQDSLSQFSYLFERGNRGWAADLGATYNHNKHWNFGLSILDLGRIRWNYKPVNYFNQIEEFTFKGIPISQFFVSSTDSLQDSFQNLLDSLSEIFSINKRNEQYSNALPSRFYLTSRYTYNKNNDVSFLFMGSFFKGRLQPAASIGYTKRFNGILEFNANWSYLNNTLANLGTGFTLNLGLTQFHVSTDNLIGVFGQYNTRSIQFRAGITFVSDYENDRPNYCDTDKDGIPNKKDGCPNEAGPIALNGCPDTDNDGTPNREDDCPLEPGLPILKGCPDKDGDQIIDKNDLCPTEPGLAYLKGCPDRDLDSIPDGEDECPNTLGLREFKGCPDRDLDSIPDKEDECPDRKGLRIFGGCPDTDGDSLPDQIDDCPTLIGLRALKGCPQIDKDGDGLKDDLDDCPEMAGPILNRGCPYDDTDKDMIPDLLDKCPTVPGSVENNGCPELEKEETQILKSAFENLEFESGKAVIRSGSFSSLDGLAELLKQKPNWQLIITGHTDNSGKAESNMLLSKNRARSVERYLIERGVKSSNIKAEWFGQTRPIESNDTEVGKQKNRRVELTVRFK